MSGDLRGIRKSSFVTYRHCQKKFEYSYNDSKYWDYGGIDGLPEDDPRVLGTKFHDACDNFFKTLEKKPLTDKFTSDWKNPFSGGKLQDWFNFFLDIEKRRYIDLISDGKEGYWRPIANELEIKMTDRLDRVGHVDRCDVLTDNNICIVEYKTGKSYNMENKYSLTNMNQEIGFYAEILNKTNAFPGRKITHWKVINPTLKKIWIARISPVSLKAVNRTFNEIVDKLEQNGVFNKNEGILCNYCDYVNDCLFGGGDLIDFGKKL